MSSRPAAASAGPRGTGAGLPAGNRVLVRLN